MIKIALIFLALKPAALQACSACGFGEDGTSLTYILTTGLLTLVPLAFIGGVVFYVKKLYFDK